MRERAFLLLLLPLLMTPVRLSHDGGLLFVAAVPNSAGEVPHLRDRRVPDQDALHPSGTSRVYDTGERGRDKPETEIASSGDPSGRPATSSQSAGEDEKDEKVTDGEKNEAEVRLGHQSGAEGRPAADGRGSKEGCAGEGDARTRTHLREDDPELTETPGKTASGNDDKEGVSTESGLNQAALTAGEESRTNIVLLGTTMAAERNDRTANDATTPIVLHAQSDHSRSSHKADTLPGTKESSLGADEPPGRNRLEGTLLVNTVPGVGERLVRGSTVRILEPEKKNSDVEVHLEDKEMPDKEYAGTEPTGRSHPVPGRKGQNTTKNLGSSMTLHPRTGLTEEFKTEGHFAEDEPDRLETADTREGHLGADKAEGHLETDKRAGQIRAEQRNGHPQADQTDGLPQADQTDGHFGDLDMRGYPGTQRTKGHLEEDTSESHPQEEADKSGLALANKSNGLPKEDKGASHIDANKTEGYLAAYRRDHADKSTGREYRLVNGRYDLKTLLGATGFNLGIQNLSKRSSNAYVSCWECELCKKPVPRSNSQINVAAVKLAFQSSDREKGIKSTVASCLANDNVPYDQKGTSGKVSCILTSRYDYRAFWLVDLGAPYTVYEISIIRRNVRDHRYTSSSTIYCQNPIRGRYVHLQKREKNNYDNNDIIICEFQVWSCEVGRYFFRNTDCRACATNCEYICDQYYGCAPEVKYNVAMLRSTAASAPEVGDSHNVVDGRTDALKKNEECYFARHDTSYTRFWRVDLNQVCRVYHLLVRGRRDCCGSLTKALNILVYRKQPPGNEAVSTFQQSETCLIWQGALQHGYTPPVNISCQPAPVYGRFVELQTLGDSRLDLCEVAVMGTPITFLSVGDEGCSTYRYKFCNFDDGLVCEDDTCKYGLLVDCRHNRGLCKKGTACDDFCKVTMEKTCNNDTECISGTICDPTAGRVCKRAPGGACNTSSDCSKNKAGYLCDFLSQCSKAEAMACSESSECAAGSSCLHSRCQCTAGTASSTRPCSPPCDLTAQTPCPQDAVCNTTINACICDANFTTHPRNFLCVPPRSAINTQCTTDANCQRGLVCRSSKCKSPLNGLCLTDEACIHGAVCDGGSCKYGAGSPCDRRDRGACRMNTVCQHGACKFKLGENCSLAEAHCAPSTVCSEISNNNKTCLLAKGSYCYDTNKTMCMAGTECDPDHVCRISAGKSCVQDTNYCNIKSKCENGICKVVPGASCKGNEHNCVEGLACDALDKCRIPQGGTCYADEYDGCAAGMYCGPLNACVCSAGITSPNCGPLAGYVGGDCNQQSLCAKSNIKCDGATGKCRCDEGYAIQRTNYTCSYGPKSPCNFTYQCGSDMVCGARHTCEILPGGSCQADHSGCVKGTFCDNDKVCRIYSKGFCTKNPRACQLGYVCDVISMCQKPVGGKCPSDDYCVAGATCVQSRCQCDSTVSSFTKGDCAADTGVTTGACDQLEILECRDKNAECNATTDRCRCTKDYQISRDFSCKKPSGQLCTNDEDCVTGTFCDTDKHCRVILDMTCDGSDMEQCGPGKVCDLNAQCKINIDGNCNGSNVVNCMAGTVCDYVYKCRLYLGAKCESSTNCPTGALCISNTCQCQEGISKEHALVCEPAAGRVGSNCSEIPCNVSGSFCQNDTCVCKTEMKVSQVFGCVLMLPATATEKGAFGVMVILFVALVILLSVSLLIVLVRSRKASGSTENEENPQGWKGTVRRLSDVVFGKKDEDEDTASSVGSSTSQIKTDDVGKEVYTADSSSSMSTSGSQAEDAMSEATDAVSEEATGVTAEEATGVTTEEATGVTTEEATDVTTEEATDVTTEEATGVTTEETDVVESLV